MQISFLGVLAIVFITLKLMGYIAWSWWWVLLPVYAPLALALVVMVLMAIGFITIQQV